MALRVKLDVIVADIPVIPLNRLLVLLWTIIVLILLRLPIGFLFMRYVRGLFYMVNPNWDTL